MGDVKESALTQKSDCKWVRALDANGNSIRISKEDLAAVVGGLLGESNTLKQRGTINLQEGSNLAKYIQDNDKSLKVGIYTVMGVDGGRTPITDWGTLERISTTSYVFLSANQKVMLSFVKDAEKWAYTKYSGEVTNGPF